MSACERCGAGFEARSRGTKTKRFCSKACRKAAEAKRARADGRKPERRVVGVLVPEALAALRTYQRERRQRLSTAEPFVPAPFLCAYCGETFTVQQRGQHYCSEEHRAAAERKRWWAREKERIKAGDPVAVRRHERTKAYVREYLHTHATHHEDRARRFGVECERVDRTAVFVRDGWRCQICGVSTPRSRQGTQHHNAPELDHRVPLSRGGAHTYDNVQCSCRRCNRSKAARRVAGQLPMFVRPAKPAKTHPNGTTP